MAFQQPQPGYASPLDAAGDDVPPPPPAHRQPVSQFSQMPDQRQYTHPNDYSDYSTPPGVTPEARPMGVPERSPNTTPFNDHYGYEQPMQPRAMYSQRPPGSSVPLAPMHSGNSSAYSDSPYNRYSSSAQNLAPQMGHINPNEVADDDDWGLGPNEYNQQNKRRSFAPFGSSRDGSQNNSPGSSINAGAVGAGAAGAAAGAAAYGGSRDGSGKYDALPTANGSQELIQEKSSWQVEDDLRKRKKNMWIVIAIIVVVVLGAILGGVLGTYLHIGGNTKPSTSADDVAEDNKDVLDINSKEIQDLMNNKDLHKVFPGMDYTPLNAQYPDCMHVGPSQNNITRDLAVMSQLTNSVRTYGTDCNQTEMLIEAIDRLELKSTMKIWQGVWLDKNDTTTDRQISQTWDLLDKGCDYFKGIIIGNEVLYRKDMSATELMKHITEFQSKIAEHHCKLPVAMADLGDNWTADMAEKVNYVMSNVHPFFAGIEAEGAADWTWNFWQTHDVSLTASNTSIKQVIAEVGWPSGGGTNCGGADSCTTGSVAGVDEMNRFMEDWVCPSLKNETEYFWFSAFDEPWKIEYNSKGKNWEDKWGLMDIDRNLKPGLKIPDCNGAKLPDYK